jgi:uncharacterized membrane protein
MLKWLLLSLLSLTSLRAEGIDPEKLSGIYTEAILFVAVFGTMAIISFIYSSRHARKYTEKQASAVAQKKALAAEQTDQREERLQQLSALVKEGLLKEEEFQILRTNI